MAKQFTTNDPVYGDTIKLAKKSGASDEQAAEVANAFLLLLNSPDQSMEQVDALKNYYATGKKYKVDVFGKDTDSKYKNILKMTVAQLPLSDEEKQKIRDDVKAQGAKAREDHEAFMARSNARIANNDAKEKERAKAYADRMDKHIEKSLERDKNRDIEDEKRERERAWKFLPIIKQGFSNFAMTKPSDQAMWDFSVKLMQNAMDEIQKNPANKPWAEEMLKVIVKVRSEFLPNGKPKTQQIKEQILNIIEQEVKKVIKEYEYDEEEPPPRNRKLEALIDFFKQEVASAGLLGDPEDFVDLAVFRFRTGEDRRPMGWIHTPDPQFGRTMKDEKKKIKNKVRALANIQNSMLADSYPSKEEGAPPKLNMFYQDDRGWKLSKEQVKKFLALLMPKLINEKDPIKAYNKFHAEELQKFWDIRKQLIVHKDVKNAVKEIKENKVATEEDKANARLQIYKIVSAVSLDTIMGQLAMHDWLLSDDKMYKKKGFEVDTNTLFHSDVSEQVENVVKDFNEHFREEEPEEPSNDLEDETDKEEEEEYTGVFGKPMGSSMPMESLQPPIFLLEEMTKDEMKKLVKNELEKNLKKMVEDELEKVLKDNKKVKNQIGDLSKEILKMLYKDLSIHHGYVIDRVKF